MRIVTAIFLAATLAACARSRSGPPAPWLSTCDIDGVRATAYCGTYEVWEDREGQPRQGSTADRKIGLRVVVLPASDTRRHDDPLFFLAGGPGDSVVNAAPFLARAFADLRRTRDVVLVDQRGTGGSHPLRCELYPGSGVRRFTGSFMPPDAIAACRDRLSAVANLALYTTSMAVDDFAEVLDALGYAQANLFGASYGTRAAQELLRRHPRLVRTLILQGVSPTDHHIPVTFARDADAALDGVLRECESDDACRAAFPAARLEAAAAVDRLKRGPVNVAVRDDDGRNVTVAFSRDLLGELLRWLMYTPIGARRIPALIHDAAAGDFSQLAALAIRRRREIMAPTGIGLYLSVTCAEDLPGIDEAEAARLAEGTVLGDYRYRAQRAACDRWVSGSVPPDFHRPVVSETPALILSGALDPVTPAASGARVAAHLKNSVHVVVPFGAHAFEGLEGQDCLQRLRREFVERGTGAGLDTSCVSSIRPPPFAQ